MTDKNSELNTTVINLKNSQYDGVSFFFGNVSVPPEEEQTDDGNLPVTFTFNIVENPQQIDIDSVDFHNHLGDILVDIILSNSDEVENDREDNTEPSA